MSVKDIRSYVMAFRFGGLFFFAPFENLDKNLIEFGAFE